MSAQQQPPEATVAEVLPQSGGSYVRQPDGTLVQQKPKAQLADLVAAKKPTTPSQE